MTKRLKIIGLILVVANSSLAFARSKGPRRAHQNTIHNNIELTVRTPTLSLLDNSGYAGGEVGLEASKRMSEHVSLYGRAQFGRTGTLGTFSGLGNSQRGFFGARLHAGSIFYVGAHVGVRNIELGAVEQREDEDYDSYEDQYYHVQTARLRAASLGVGTSIGILHKVRSFAIGVELLDAFAPVAALTSSGAASRSDVDIDAKEAARRLAMKGDVAVPRLLIKVATRI